MNEKVMFCPEYFLNPVFFKKTKPKKNVFVFVHDLSVKWGEGEKKKVSEMREKGKQIPTFRTDLRVAHAVC